MTFVKLGVRLLTVVGPMCLVVSLRAAAPPLQLPNDVIPYAVRASGPVKRVVVTNSESPGAQTIATYDEGHRISEIEERDSTGTTRTIAHFIYERFGLAEIRWVDAQGKLLRLFAQTFSETGRRTSYYESDAAGRVLWKEIFDPTDPSPDPVRRRFWLDLAPGRQLAEVTELVDCHGKCSETTLLVQNRVRATWRIYRDKSNRVVKDDIDYYDLSFSYRHHERDGSTDEHNFSSANQVHTFVRRNAAGDVTSITREPASGPSATTIYHYGSDGLEDSEIRKENGDTASKRFTYGSDAQGNWTTQVITAEHQGRTTIRREIDYSRSGQ